MSQFSSIISVLVLDPTGSLFVDQVDHDLFVKNTVRGLKRNGSAGGWCRRRTVIVTSHLPKLSVKLDAVFRKNLPNTYRIVVSYRKLRIQYLKPLYVNGI